MISPFPLRSVCANVISRLSIESELWLVVSSDHSSSRSSELAWSLLMNRSPASFKMPVEKGTWPVSRPINRLSILPAYSHISTPAFFLFLSSHSYESTTLFEIDSRDQIWTAVTCIVSPLPLLRPSSYGRLAHWRPNTRSRRFAQNIRSLWIHSNLVLSFVRIGRS